MIVKTPAFFDKWLQKSWKQRLQVHLVKLTLSFVSCLYLLLRIKQDYVLGAEWLPGCSDENQKGPIVSKDAHWLLQVDFPLWTLYLKTGYKVSCSYYLYVKADLLNKFLK